MTRLGNTLPTSESFPWSAPLFSALRFDREIKRRAKL